MADIDARTDEELVRCAQAGEVAAFNILYERYLDVVYQRVRYSVPQADVEDVTQETFIAVIRSLKEFRCDSKFRTWLYTILGRKIADYYRRSDPADFEWIKGEDNGDDDSVNQISQILDGTNSANIDDVIWIRQALLRLSPHYREVILLRFVDGLSFLEIANQLGQSLDATKSLFRRAISTLQQDLEKTHA
ncbi:RNA polymerase sigma factor, sigma-70 family [Longilinea arvoryzae]|uniref:RNA polymerase sigma factor n=1 Tax=Longilinea arvoryzae TaxID=360412 RepID=A0A0S7BIE7_9CHLR|nr:sigma-70 family RNA polymerase sigma factor [Longilinea arvoryzae]GAP13659.1 RNA polymerase sigma factor, sigma-70 family [Longilinea arvoryzae]